MALEDPQAVFYAVIAICVVAYVVRWRTDPVSISCSQCREVYVLSSGRRSSQMASIPAVGGPSAPIISFLSSIRYLKCGKELIAEGYRRVRIRAVRWVCAWSMSD